MSIRRFFYACMHERYSNEHTVYLCISVPKVHGTQRDSRRPFGWRDAIDPSEVVHPPVKFVWLRISPNYDACLTFVTLYILLY